MIGETRAEMGGSHYHLINQLSGGIVPQPAPDAIDNFRRLHQAISKGVIQACHDCSEGGLAVAAAEMCIAGNLGARLSLDAALPPEISAFSESSGRLIVEVQPEDAQAFEQFMSSTPFSLIGTVEAVPALIVQDENGRELLNLTLTQLEGAWRGEVSHAVPQSPPPIAASGRAAIALTHYHAAPKVIILHANGTNRDREAALACQMAGGLPEIVHINQLLRGEKQLADYHMLVLPGGFSYGDDLGAGVLWALDLVTQLGGEIEKFIQTGRPVLGICNGFQALVKAGFLPALEGERKVTLTRNEFERFECRWIYLKPNPHSPNLFTQGLDDLIYCPVAHGEGRVMTADSETLNTIWSGGLAALTYVDADGEPAAYPYNPNGSVYGIAGLCNPAGNVLGLMPHPEDHIFTWQHPRWQRGEGGLLGIKLFQNAIKHA